MPGDVRGPWAGSGPDGSGGSGLMQEHTNKQTNFALYIVDCDDDVTAYIFESQLILRLVLFLFCFSTHLFSSISMSCVWPCLSYFENLDLCKDERTSQRADS